MVADGVSIRLHLDVSVDELLKIQKNWKESGCRSLKEYTLQLLLAESKKVQES